MPVQSRLEHGVFLEVPGFSLERGVLIQPVVANGPGFHEEVEKGLVDAHDFVLAGEEVV